MALTLSYLASRPKTTETQKQRLLKEADKYINQALHLLSSEEHSLEAERLDGAETPTTDDLKYQFTKLFLLLRGLRMNERTTGQQSRHTKRPEPMT
jgi:hypothetical protein